MNVDIPRPPRLSPSLIGVLAAVLAATVALTACADDGFVVIDPPADDPATPGDSTPFGERGSWGVGLIERSFRVRVDEVVDGDIYLPLASLDRTADGPFPVVVSVHGGLVAPEQYRWLNAHVASRGFVVIAPHSASDLAIFQTGNGKELLEVVRELSERGDGPLAGMLDEGPAVAMGHSLGGVVAAKLWLYAPEEFSHLALLASYPADFEDYERKRAPQRDGDAVLSIIGSRDARTEDPVRLAREGFERIDEALDVTGTFAIVEGMNHYQWGDLSSADTLRRDKAPTIDDEVARRRSMTIVDAFLAGVRSERPDLLDEPADWPEGVVTWERYREGRE